MKSNAFFKWWVVTLATAVVTFWLYRFDVLTTMLVADASYMVATTMAVYVLAAAYIGKLSYNISNLNYFSTETDLEAGWFASDLCMTLGLLGTVIGFIFMMKYNLVGADLTNVATTSKVLANIISSMGTALYTTAVGCALGSILKIQCFVLQREIESYRK